MVASQRSRQDSCNDVTAIGRPRDEKRRQDLQARAAEVLLERRSCEVSLKDLADALGESSRMLVHHFGSRDALIAEALAYARTGFLAKIRAEIDARRPTDLRSLVIALRAIVTAPQNRPYFRLFDQVNALAQTDPERFPGFGRTSVHDWLPQFVDVLRASTSDAAEAEAQATLALGVIRGLMLDQNATGEAARVDAAFRAFDSL